MWVTRTATGWPTWWLYAPGENAGAGSVWSFRSAGEHVVSPGGVPIPATVLGPNGTLTFGHSLLGTTAAKARLGSGFAN